ncbi:MAG: SapC family protein, partial [Pseudomonadota bacterium]
ANVVKNQDEGQVLFGDVAQPTESTKSILEFCTKFEESGQRTKAFIEELKKLDILMDGEIAITRGDSPDQPFVYRGFQMVDEKKLRELSGEQLTALNANGMLLLIHAHMFSLNLMRNLFERQAAQGKVPLPEPTPAAS